MFVRVLQIKWKEGQKIPIKLDKTFHIICVYTKQARLLLRQIIDLLLFQGGVICALCSTKDDTGYQKAFSYILKLFFLLMKYGREIQSNRKQTNKVVLTIS